jgi:hypothetical protein
MVICLFLSLLSQLLKISSRIVCIEVVELIFFNILIKGLQKPVRCIKVHYFSYVDYKFHDGLWAYDRFIPLHSVVVAAAERIVQMAAQTPALHVGINLCLRPKGVHSSIHFFIFRISIYR